MFKYTQKVSNIVQGKRPTFLGLGEWLLNKRWWLVLLASGSVFLYEFLEHGPLLRNTPNIFAYELFFYGIILPVSAGLIFSQLAASRSELAWMIYSQNLISNLGGQLQEVHTTHDLADAFLQFVKVVMPLNGASIYSYDQHTRKYKSILTWSSKKELDITNAPLKCKAENCPCLADSPERENVALQPCRDPHESALSDIATCYCLPISYSDIPVASARFYFPVRSLPSQDQTRLLNEVAPLVASTFRRIHLEQLMKSQNKIVESEQQRIARDVHDTLGHSLAFIRLRLDQISLEFDAAKPDTVRKDVETLRDVAKEAYDQMREVLVKLSPDEKLNLNNTLVNYAERIGQRANFHVRVHQDGERRTLDQLAQRNIFYIFQEIFTNIEKHARAHKVDVNLKWLDDGLELKVEDDGIGFDPTRPIPNGHFGLQNMRERAKESDAHLNISSGPNQGTQIILFTPYEG
jgi:signal transduction histidine kinase